MKASVPSCPLSLSESEGGADGAGRLPLLSESEGGR
jgi:hypothetical protein